MLNNKKYVITIDLTVLFLLSITAIQVVFFLYYQHYFTQEIKALHVELIDTKQELTALKSLYLTDLPKNSHIPQPASNSSFYNYKVLSAVAVLSGIGLSVGAYYSYHYIVTNTLTLKFLLPTFATNFLTNNFGLFKKVDSYILVDKESGVSVIAEVVRGSVIDTNLFFKLPDMIDFLPMAYFTTWIYSKPRGNASTPQPPRTPNTAFNQESIVEDLTTSVPAVEELVTFTPTVEQVSTSVIENQGLIGSTVQNILHLLP